MTATLTQRLDMTSLDDAPTARQAPASLAERMLRDTGYNLSAFVVAVPAFVIAVTGVALGLGLAILFVGLPILVLTVYAARGFADLERLRLRSMLGRTAPRPAYVTAEPGRGAFRRNITPLLDPQSWLDVAWSLFGFATGTVAFAVTVGWVAGALGGLSYWFWQQFITFGPDSTTLAELIGFGRGRTPESWLNFGLGVFALVTLPLVVRLMAVMHSSLASALLCSRAELQREVRRVQGGREAARKAEADSLRRLERDIHDGPQQRLVRLQMDLGRAGKQLDVDPQQARATIDSAMQQARDAVDELRSLSRGIAPPVLVDRGLAAALDEAFARSTVPVHSRLDLPPTLPTHVETTVYFVVSEALTNVAKHAGASRVDVSVAQVGQRIWVEVSDDGVGGAELGKGHGLAGLEQRVRAADGSLAVSSPAGGPTTVRAEVSCES